MVRGLLIAVTRDPRKVVVRLVLARQPLSDARAGSQGERAALPFSAGSDGGAR